MKTRSLTALGLSFFFSVATAWAATPCPQSCPTDKAGPYKPTWESLKHYEIPDWYLDAKFGIFIHWGVYSVPAFGNEWYPANMYKRDHKAFEYHRKTFGDQSVFGYKDFIPKFTADRWDPVAWAKLFKDAGARYVVPVAEHHDGFPMYDCSYTHYDASEMGPRRDIVGELAKALRAEGLKVGASSHRGKNWSYYTREPDFDTADPRYAGLYGACADRNTPADQAFLDDWYARTTEIVDKYQPDLMWFDFGFERPEFEPYRKRFAAHYYNQAVRWHKPVVINFKHKGYPEDVAVLDVERGSLDKLHQHFWQTDTSVCRRSWGYIKDHEYRTVDSLVDDLVDIVSKNGCLLLNIGPRPDGTIPEPQQEILLSIGRWLTVNGEAIYGSRPWKIYGEGPTEVVSGDFAEKKNKAFTARDVRFTTKGETLYATVLGWPEDTFKIESLKASSDLFSQEIADVQLLGCSAKLTWSRDADALTVQLPAEKPCEHAFVLKITPRSSK